MNTTARALTVCLAACFFLTATASAAPLSVYIQDHIFTFQTAPGAAVYDFNGDGPDQLAVNTQGTATTGVASYRFNGIAPQVGGVGPGFYPVWTTADQSPYDLVAFGGHIEMTLHFDASDGPYTNALGDTFDISLSGLFGHLTITGQLGNPNLPVAAPPIVLLDMAFNATTLLGRADHNTIDLIEATGTVTTLLGQDIANMGFEGAVKFAFFADDDQAAIFDTSLYQGAYDPSANIQGLVSGHVAGETSAIPEPATLSLLALAGAVAFKRTRRR